MKPLIMKTPKLLAAALLGFAAGPALAHPADAGGLLHGLAHPFTGIDHLLAMVLVGVWAARHRGVPRLALPGGFVSGLISGAAGGLAGAALPAVEPMILASIAVFAAALLAAARVPLAAGVLLAGFFGLFHGYAHVAEMPAGAGAAAFASGMVAGTALLHGAGLVLGALIGIRVPRFSLAR